ncbi:MAG: TIGR02677 family protein [Eubacteriaceae bacterium]|nr:TIGR02677 family protein [Eubacteriaceae bacterium]
MKFEITSKLTKQIDEMRYLTVENAWRYRSILRYFYLQYEKMKYWLYKEDIYEALKINDEFKEYTMEMCRQDLDVLLTWKNLSALQDTSKVSTVEEFKNKQFRYQLSEYSVEIERLTIRLENLFIETASLEPTLLERLREELKKLPQVAKLSEKEVGSWWSGLNSDFKRLNQNYQDYIRDLYTIKAEEMMKTQEFMVFKDKFIQYLRDFVKGLHHHANAIESILKNFRSMDIEIVLKKTIDYEISIPRIDADIDEEGIRENIIGRWDNLNTWFLGTKGNQSEAAKLMDITNDIIRKITRYASQISESRTSAINRKEEYRKLGQLFSQCKDTREAHKLSSLSFGIFHMKHIKSDIFRETESISSDVFEESPVVYTVKPRVRGYQEKAKRSPIRSNTEKKEAMMNKVRAEREIEEKTIENYVIKGCIDFSSLPVIEEHVRKTLLKWLCKGINSTVNKGKTEDGRVFQVETPKESEKRCILRCEDGNLEMPAYILRFVGVENEGA